MLFSYHSAIVISHRQHDPNVHFKSLTDMLPAVLIHPVDFLPLSLPAQVYHFIFQRYKNTLGSSHQSLFLLCRLKLGCSDICGGLFGHRFTSTSKFKFSARHNLRLLFLCYYEKKEKSHPVSQNTDYRQYLHVNIFLCVWMKALKILKGIKTFNLCCYYFFALRCFISVFSFFFFLNLSVSFQCRWFSLSTFCHFYGILRKG